jgi:hypothetical protein
MQPFFFAIQPCLDVIAGIPLARGLTIPTGGRLTLSLQRVALGNVAGERNRDVPLLLYWPHS